jgi:ABC-2 type transport system permease protein
VTAADRDASLETAAGALIPLGERGRRRGLTNLLRAGFASWWRTKEWWVQALIWTAVANAPLAGILWSETELSETDAVTIYGVLTMFAAIAVAILMQEQIVGEKKSGTAEWVLSKPVSRDAFVIAKLVPNAVGVVATMALIPGAVTYAHLRLAGVELSGAGFTAALGLVALNLLFYLTLSLMLGTLTDSSAAVIAVPLAFAFGQQFLGSVPGLVHVLPYRLVAPLGETPEGGPALSNMSALALGEPLPAAGAIFVTAAACLVFVAVALARFSRTEF